MRTFSLGGRTVGPGTPCFVIAEAGVNHNGDAAQALALVDAAADAGADAVKFQTFRAQLLASPSAPKADYQRASGGPEESQLEMLERLELSEALHRDLAARARSRGICFLSTPFDEPSADFLETLGMEAFKVPSGELTNPVLLTHIARKRRPMIISTGMAVIDEVADAIADVRSVADVPMVLLHCVSRYPASAEEVNLRAMATMREQLALPVGYSDHTLGPDIALAAAALGACVIEKHFTLDRELPGPDHRASMEPREFREMIGAIRRIESSLGDGIKRPCPAEQETATVARKSVVAAVDIPAGTTLSADMLSIRRPGNGVRPRDMSTVIGRRAVRAISAGIPIQRDDIL